MGTSTASHTLSVYLFEFKGADENRLNSLDVCSQSIQQLISIAGMNLIKTLSHTFEPQGISIIALLAESHIAIHTWPEMNTGYITLTTCKEPHEDFTSLAQAALTELFVCTTVDLKRIAP